MFDELKEQLLKKYTEKDFLEGGCYYFAQSVVNQYGGQIYINRQLEHCAIMYEGFLYDIRGKIRNIDGFRPLKQWEIQMCEKEYKLPKK